MEMVAYCYINTDKEWKITQGSSELLFLNFVTIFVNTCFFYKQHFFSTQPQCCLTFSWFGFQVLLRCCLVHISIIIISRPIFTIVSMSRCRSIYVVSMWSFFIFIIINCIISWIQIHLFFCLFYRICSIIFGW